MNKILVIAAHPDDELLGLGGTIRKRVDNGDEAFCLILGEGLTSRLNDRIQTDKKDIKSLHIDAKKASRIIGFKNIFFRNFPDNRFDSIDMLDVVKGIEEYIDYLKPNIIYTHHIGDRNIDHQITHEAVLTATRPVGAHIVKKIYAFETPSSTEWGFIGGNKSFSPNVFEDISSTIQIKLNAMSCYKTELKEYPHPRSLDALKIISERWGTIINTKNAEAFILVREIMD